MSAWPQAVWITKQLKVSIQQNMESMSTIEEYQEDLTKWNDESLVPTQNKLEDLKNQVASISSNVHAPIIDTDDDGDSVPDNSQGEQIEVGTIWFLVQGDQGGGSQDDQGGGSQDDQGQDDTITDLSGTIWYFNGELNLPNQSNSYSINFKSNGSSFTAMQICFYNDYDENYYFRYTNGSNIIIPYLNPYSPNTWEDESFRIIFISGGDDATDNTLISWLQENATLITGS